MQLLWAEGLDAHLILAGPSLRSFDEYLQSQSIPGSRLMNFGPVSDKDKLDLLAAADIVVQPSSVESLGLVYLEAWANQKCVIAADIAVTREVISHGEDGLLVPYGDPGQLAIAIKSFAGDPEKRSSLGRKGHAKLLRQFQWKQTFERIASCILNETAR
jgi:glycogen synthase